MSADAVPVDIWASWSTDPHLIERRRAKAAREGLRFQCEACGRGLRDGSGYNVVIVDGGFKALAPALWGEPEIEEDSGYMGMYDLGPECGKLVPAAYRVKRGVT